jgi:fatty-acyl-CoA synthase
MNEANPTAAELRRSNPAWTHRTVWSVLERKACERPDETFLLAEESTGRLTELTYAAFLRRSRILSAGLAEIGVRSGDRVALWMTNLPEFAVLMFAIMRIGAAVVPVNTYVGASEVEYKLRRSGARHLVLLDQFRNMDFRAILAGIAPEWATAHRGSLRSAALPDLRNIVVLNRQQPTAITRNAFELAQLEAPQDQSLSLADELCASTRPDDLGLILFTSGSTGSPKGVRLQQWGLITNAELHSHRLGITESDRYFSQMPLFHVGGCIWGLMTMLTCGGTLVMGETNDPRQAIRMLEEEHCTIYFGTPAMHYDMANSPALEQRAFESVRLAAHLVDGNLRAELWYPRGVRHFFSAYGLTETYGPVTCPDSTDPDQEGTLGKALDGWEITIVDPASGEPRPPGEPGLIKLRGMVFDGYHDMPQETADVIDADGCFSTGDLGVVEPNGVLRVIGRMKLMLKVGGENVAVEEVENAIIEFPGVGEACVIGVPERRLGEVPYAYITIRNADVNIDELSAHVARRLARFKRPRRYVIVDSLPLIGSGKIDRALVAKAAPREHVRLEG